MSKIKELEQENNRLRDIIYELYVVIELASSASERLADAMKELNDIIYERKIEKK